MRGVALLVTKMALLRCNSVLWECLPISLAPTINVTFVTFGCISTVCAWTADKGRNVTFVTPAGAAANP